MKRLLFLILVFALLSAGFFIGRSRQTSDLLKKHILPEISAATGMQATARKMYINLFPLFIGARDLKISDGNKDVLHVPAIKGYIELTGFLKKELVLRRLVITGPDLKTDGAGIQDVVKRIKEYLGKERKTPLAVAVKAVVVRDGGFSLEYGNGLFKGYGVNVEAVLDAPSNDAFMPRVNFRLKKVSSQIKGWPALEADMSGDAVFKEKSVDVRSLNAGFYGSSIKASGIYQFGPGTGESESSAGTGSFQVQMNILPQSLKKIFGLKHRGDGNVYAKGSIKVLGSDLLGSVIDLDLNGGFYVQTLMELLKVEEKVEGLVDFSGNIQGPARDITGRAKAHLKDGNLYDVEVNDLACKVAYKDYALNFTEGRSVLYNGRAEAEASVTIVGPTHYSLDVRFNDVDSLPVLRLIGWIPDIPLGKVNGRVNTAGYAFNPSGWFDYRSIQRGDDVMGRIERIKGSYNLMEGLLTLTGVEATTGRTSMTAGGNVDIPSKNLALNVHISASDLTDVTLPYLGELRGTGEFSGTLTGIFDDPVISGAMMLKSASFDRYDIGDVSGHIAYKMNFLEVKSLISSVRHQGYQQTAALSGNIGFPHAAKLFEFKSPVYALSVSAQNADLEKTVKFVYRKKLAAYPSGRLDADFRINGAGPKPSYDGTLRINKAAVNSYAVADSADMSFSYNYRNFIVRNGHFKKGNSAFAAEGSLSANDSFIFSASGAGIFLKDMPAFAAPFDAVFGFKAEGRGTLDNPEVFFKGVMGRQKISGVEIGEGELGAALNGRKLKVEAKLIGGNVLFKGMADLRGYMPWTARLDVRPGRYDFLLSALLKDRPEDLLINVKGSADMHGDKEHFFASADIDRINLNLFGYNFSNESGIHLEIRDKNIVLPFVRMRSGNASFSIRGTAGTTKGYDIVLEGSSALSPIKGFIKRIDAIRGDADFVFSITGDWDSPKINGGVNIANALLGVKDLPHRISSVNGYFFIDENRIVIQKLSGKIGGGDMDLSGIAYLQKFRMKKFYLDAVMNNVGINMSKDFALNFNGNIFVKGSPESQAVSGEVRLNKVRYNERVEWKSWFLMAKTKERPRGDFGAFEKAGLNIRIYGSENISVNNNIARAQLKVDTSLRGTVASPVLFGRIESESGTVYFRNNEFRIVKAIADFSDPRRMNPAMEIIAETAIKGYNVRLNLEGQIDHFNLSLLSDPPLEEMDILSLLTVGRFGKELKGIESGIGAGEATSFLTGKMQDVMEERAKTLTGLDRVEVDPYVSKVTGTISPRITVSKRLLGDRLFVTYSSAASSAENNVIRLEYALSKNISLVGLRDEKGSMGTDVKFRFEFK